MQVSCEIDAGARSAAPACRCEPSHHDFVSWDTVLLCLKSRHGGERWRLGAQIAGQSPLRLIFHIGFAGGTLWTAGFEITCGHTSFKVNGGCSAACMPVRHPRISEHSDVEIHSAAMYLNISRRPANHVAPLIRPSIRTSVAPSNRWALTAGRDSSPMTG